jgi:hypothetical protein
MQQSTTSRAGTAEKLRRIVSYRPDGKWGSAGKKRFRKFSGEVSGFPRIFLVLPDPRTYIPSIPLPGVNFDTRYWVFIGLAVFFSTVASASTCYLASVEEHFMECNSISAALFDTIGMVPTMVLGILLLIPVMVAIPYIFGQNEKAGLISMVLMGIIVLYTAFDAVNNISAIMGFYETYHAAHRVLSETNNVTGNIVGTGESHC